MDIRHCNIKKQEKLRKKGKLTDVLIKIKYYGLAIRRNIDSIVNMEKAIMTTFHHLCSTNENLHENCPPESESWCK